MILLCSTIGNVVGCDNEEGENKGDFSQCVETSQSFSPLYELLRQSLLLGSEPDPTRPFGWAFISSDWLTNNPFIWFSEKDGKALLLKIAEDHSLSLEKNRPVIYEITRIPVWQQIDYCFNQQQDYGLTVAIKNGRLDLAKLLVGSYWQLTKYPKRNKFLKLLIDNENKFKVKAHELIDFTNRFFDDKQSIDFLKQYDKKKKQDSIVIKHVEQHNEKLRILKTAQDEKNKIKTEKRNEKLFQKYIKKN